MLEGEDKMALNLNGTAATNEGALRAFLHAPESDRRFRLLLPEFGGPAKLDSDPPASDFSYQGHTFAERDARAASHVQALLDRVVDIGNVTLESATPTIQTQDVSFLFGSRSNRSTQALLQDLHTNLFQFEFSDNWSILCAGKRFSLPDPTLLTTTQYAVANDYGVIARVRSAGSPIFMIAGLGGRATEGCGLYFRKHWEDLDRQFGTQDFAVVLQFLAPFDVAQVTQVAEASQLATL